MLKFMYLSTLDKRALDLYNTMQPLSSVQTNIDLEQCYPNKNRRHLCILEVPNDPI